MIELSKSPSKKLSRWKGRTFLSQIIKTFNFTRTSSQETDCRTDTPADQTKISAISFMQELRGEI